MITKGTVYDFFEALRNFLLSFDGLEDLEFFEASNLDEIERVFLEEALTHCAYLLNNLTGYLEYTKTKE